jgi:hypothetical protein
MRVSGTHAQTHMPLHRANQKQPARIAGKPISFYLDHNGITNDAKLYYQGKLTPGHDTRTYALLDSALTHNTETRPFYFFVLNQIMKPTDDPLTENIAPICTRYFSQYSCEFVAWQKDAVFEVNARQWATFIAFDLYTPEALKKYSTELKTGSCQTQALDNFLNDLGRIVAEINEH